MGFPVALYKFSFGSNSSVIDCSGCRVMISNTLSFSNENTLIKVVVLISSHS